MEKRENKVLFNLKNVHYAVLENGDTPTWGTPVAVPGAVSIALSAEGDVYEFYADGIVYYGTRANNGYSGDLTVALIPDQMMQDVFGMQLDGTAKVVIENANADIKHFALLFQIEGDATARNYVLYNCLAERPNISANTNTETRDVQTQAMSLTARPTANGLVHAHTTAETSDESMQAWYSSVWVPATQANA